MTELADFGADVIKVEPPGSGDTYRRATGAAIAAAGFDGVNFLWQLENRNKRSLALKLKSPGAASVLERLVKWADVLVTNFPAHTRAKLGVDYGRLARLNPRLIYADITGFGEVGPGGGGTRVRHEPAYWARSGPLDIMRQRSGPPPATVWGSGDHPTAINLYAGIMTALYRRQKKGQGARVTASLIAGGAWAAGCAIQAALAGAKGPAPTDRTNPLTGPLDNVYRTSDDRWLALAFFNEDKQLPLFLDAVGHAQAAKDLRFKDAKSRRAHTAEAVALLDEIFATRTRAEWRTLFSAAASTQC